MIAAIEQLKVYKQTLETNLPINRAEGNNEQADLEALSLEQVNEALALLESVSDEEFQARAAAEYEAGKDGHVGPESPFMRAKFRVSTVNPPEVAVVPGEHVAPMQSLVAYPVCKSDAYPADGSDEDNSFAKWSPSGKLELSIVNPNLSNKIKEGDVFYLDFTKATK